MMLTIKLTFFAFFLGIALAIPMNSIEQDDRDIEQIPVPFGIPAQYRTSEFS